MTVTVPDRAEFFGPNLLADQVLAFLDDELEEGVEVGDEPVGYTESVLVTGGDGVAATATEDATIVAFSINPDAPVTRQGTIGR